MNAQTTITISGTLRGQIWMPAAETTKDFRETFTPDDRPFSRQWNGLRDALLYVTNDGDFQACDIEYAVISVRCVKNGKIVTITSEIPPTAKLVSDLFCAYRDACYCGEEEE